MERGEIVATPLRDRSHPAADRQIAYSGPGRQHDQPDRPGVWAAPGRSVPAERVGEPSHNRGDVQRSQPVESGIPDDDRQNTGAAVGVRPSTRQRHGED